MDGLKLINPEFSIEFGAKTFNVRRANIEKVIQFQTRMMELAEAKDKSIDIKGAAYCLYLVLVDSDPTVTEDYVTKNAPGDLDPYQIFEQLGFLNRQKVELMRKTMQRNAPVQTGEQSSAQ